MADGACAALARPAGPHADCRRIGVGGARAAPVAAPVPRVERAADFCLLLDGVQDPGNVGSMLRSAAAVGVAQVFMSPHCAFAWSPKVLRAGQGAHFHLAIFEGIDLGGWARAYRGKVVAMVAAEGTSLYEADLTGPLARLVSIDTSDAARDIHELWF